MNCKNNCDGHCVPFAQICSFSSFERVEGLCVCVRVCVCVGVGGWVGEWVWVCDGGVEGHSKCTERLSRTLTSGTH